MGKPDETHGDVHTDKLGLTWKLLVSQAHQLLRLIQKAVSSLVLKE